MDLKEALMHVPVYPQFADGKPLEEDEILENLWLNQRKLMDRYIGIKALPPYPFSAYNKSEQMQLRDISSRATGELAEWFEEYYKFMAHYIEKPSIERANQMNILRVKMHQEFGDFLHFVIEILIYSNIGVKDLNALMHQYCKDELQQPSLMNLDQGFYANVTYLTNFFLQKKFGTDRRAMRTLPYTATNLLDMGQPGDISAMSVYEIMAWRCTYSLEKAVNELKAKPWVQTPPSPDLEKYQLLLSYWAINTFVFAVSVGYNLKSLSLVYRGTNYINHYRLDTKR